MKKVANIFINILVAIVIALSAIFSISTIKRGYTNFCGYSTVLVLSNSMSDSGIKRGDVKLIHKADSYKIGDIIAFYYGDEEEPIIMYHQIIGETEDGGFITKGSSNKLPDARTTYSENIIGKQVNNLNYKLIVSVPFKVSLILLAYIIVMIYIGWVISDIFRDETERSLRIKNRKIVKNKCGKIIIPLLVLFSSLCICGRIQGVFCIEMNTLETKQTINFIGHNWDGSDKLNDDALSASLELKYALNNPSSDEGKALASAINARKSSDWIGNMDQISNVADNLDKVITAPDACTYIIKIKSTSSYELYITYEDYSNMRLYTRFGPVYKIVFTMNYSGEYEITSSDVGTATVTYYDIKNNQMQLSFNTDEFQSNN